MIGFVKLNRSEDTLALMKDKNAFILLTQIAIRARRKSGFDTDGLGASEAMIGDHKSIGLTMREYRTAKCHLERYGFSTFKTTSKGTIAKLINTRIFDINEDTGDNLNDKQATT